MTGLSTLGSWSARRWVTVVVVAVATALVLGVPTDVIPNPVFGRQGTPVTWWSYPVLAITSVLSGMLFATYVRNGSTSTPAQSNGGDELEQLDKPGKLASVGGLLSYFAIGCPICNKIVFLALGAAGAVKWFAPVQPYLGVVSMLLIAWALVTRLRGELACPVVPSASNAAASDDSATPAIQFDSATDAIVSPR